MHACMHVSMHAFMHACIDFKCLAYIELQVEAGLTESTGTVMAGVEGTAAA